MFVASSAFSHTPQLLFCVLPLKVCSQIHCFVSWCRFRLYSLNTAIVSWHNKHTALFPVLPNKYLFVYSSLNTRHSSPILRFFGGFRVSLKLEIYIFTVAKTKLKLTRSTRKALRIVSTLRIRIDVVVLVENTRRIFGRAREGNLGSRLIFLIVLAGHKKKS
jgi:hypothetical protein